MARGRSADIHFDYNDYSVRAQDGEILKSNADWMCKHSAARVQIEGHCDDRGSEEYNIALGAKRAQAAKDYLETLGVSGRPDVDHQLRQGTAGLHRGHRRMLGTEPARPLRGSAVARMAARMFDNRKLGLGVVGLLALALGAGGLRGAADVSGTQNEQSDARR